MDHRGSWLQICAAHRFAGDRDGMAIGERCGRPGACINCSIGDIDVACCRASILEGDLIPRIGVAGICADLQRNALTLLDVDRFAAVVAFQQHVLQRNIVKQLDAVSAHNRASRMGSGPLETGENIIGGTARQAGYGCGTDLICAPIRRRGRVVNILAVGVVVRDFKAGVSACAILHGLQLNNLGIIVIVGLADLHRLADDLAEIALRRDLHADADSITHVSRHGSVLATGLALNIRPCAAAVRAALPLIAQFAAIKAGGQVAGTGGNGATEDDAAGVVHIAREGGIGYNHRRLIHHQPNDMLVAENADVAAVLLQIQLQIKGIDLGVCAFLNGDRMRGFTGIDGICLLYCSRTGEIMLALGSIAIACVFQLLRQRIPLELEGMRRAVVHLLNCAIPVLGVVDGVAVQRDGLHHTPCVADDLDGSARVKFQIEIINIFPHERLNVLGGIELSVYLYRTIREALHGVKYHFQPGTRCGIRIHPIAIAICGKHCKCRVWDSCRASRTRRS